MAKIRSKQEEQLYTLTKRLLFYSHCLANECLELGGKDFRSAALFTEARDVLDQVGAKRHN